MRTKPLSLLVPGLMLALLVGVVGVLLFPRDVSGDEFKQIVIASHQSSSTTWRLYRETSDEYCFQLSQSLLPQNYCVPRRDLRVLNGPDGHATLGYIRQNDLELVAGRHPGAVRDVF
jgi:hypothetical protein